MSGTIHGLTIKGDIVVEMPTNITTNHKLGDRLRNAWRCLRGKNLEGIGGLSVISCVFQDGGNIRVEGKI